MYSEQDLFGFIFIFIHELDPPICRSKKIGLSSLVCNDPERVTC